jgi:hypothetical protein
MTTRSKSLEDRADIEEAREALREAREKGTISLADLKAELGDGKPSARVQHLLGTLDSGVPDLAENHQAYILESAKRDE